MNDDANVQFPECPRCGAPPGQAHDPTCTWGDKPTVTIMEIAYAVTALPTEDVNSGDWSIRVERTAPDIFAVRFHGRCWNFTTNDWDYEPLPSSRTDEWLAHTRRDLDTCLALAALLAPKVTVNGLTAAGYLEWKERHASSGH